MQLRGLGRFVAALGVTAMLASSLGAGYATAGSRLSGRNAARVLKPGSHVHIMPTRSLARSIGLIGTAPPSGTLTYHGGPVMRRGTRSIPIFWEPSRLQDGTPAPVDANYNALIQRFLNDYGGTGRYSIMTQYYETGPQYIVNSSGMMIAIVDTSPYPSADVLGCGENGLVNCVSNDQIATEIAKVITAGNLPRNYATFYPLFTDPHEDSCFDGLDCFVPEPPSTHWVYCAYHSIFYMGDVSHPVIFANMPYLHTNANSDFGCGGTGVTDPNADLAFDYETGALSHEFDESITDPDTGGGWWDDGTGYENGDVCNGLAAPVMWGTHPYSVQTDWSQQTSACLSGGSHRITLSALNGAAGSSVNVTGSGFQVSTSLTWTFTDSAGTVTSVAAPPTSDPSGTFAATAFAIPGGAAAGRGTIEVVGVTPDDGAAADFTVGAATRRPDSLIGRTRIGRWTGNNIYNTTGVSQSLKVSVRRGRAYTFYAQIQNDGNIADTLSVRGTKAPVGFAIVYLVGSTNVTTRVEAGTYRPALAAGSAFIMQIRITVKGSTPVGRTFKDVILATSRSDATRKDLVVETVKAI